MDVSRVSRNDWIIGGGFVLMFIGTVAPWYGVDLGFASVTANGWHGSYLGWLTFILCLAAALAVLRHVVADLAIALPDAVIAVACGGVSALIVVIRIFTKPQFTGLRWGIFVALAGALVVAVAGFLKYGEVGTPAAATMAPPAPAGVPAQAVPPPPPPAAPVQASPPPPPAPAAQPAPPAPAAPGPAAEDRTPAVEPSSGASASRFCIKCGSALPSSEARFCAKCGTPRQQA
jgi:hypothetical protein